MRVVISDSSALIDLAKVQLIEPLLALPYEFVIPDAIYDNELLELHHYSRAQLLELGFRISTLDGTQVERAIVYGHRFLALTLEDRFALVLAEDTEGCLLLTGDKQLRTVAAAQGLPVHGILWACDQMQQHGTIELRMLLNALRALQADRLVFLPDRELRSRIERLVKQVSDG